MNPIIAAGTAIFREPIALAMTLVAAICAIASIRRWTRLVDRLLAAGLAALSGITAWMIASHWQWPW